MLRRILDSSVIVPLLLALLTVVFPSLGWAATQVLESGRPIIDPAEMTHALPALFCVTVFIISYMFVLTEEYSHLRKSKPVLLGAGIIWITIGFIAKDKGIDHETLRSAIFHGLEEYSSLLLFLLAAMTYIAALEERNVFGALRGWLVQKGMSLRQLFWVTGVLAFCISPVADNLTTALVMGAVVMAVGSASPRFVVLSCISIVNAANAGGAFSPFGDITTLMVWQAGHVSFFEFFDLFLPSLTMFAVPAIIMTPFVPSGKPEALEHEEHMKRGAKIYMFLGVCTIALAVSLENFLGVPPFMGMMTGMGMLMMTSYFLKLTAKGTDDFDILEQVRAAEWDTLLFFFGVIFSVGGLAFLGYMELASNLMFDEMGADVTNIVLGLISAVIDNIPVMFAVLTMDPEMSHFHWMLITLTTGVGGSLLSIGSAAGVALMGTARGQYTFVSHLKWTPVILLGYAAAIGVHYLVNARFEQVTGLVTP
ncbi:MAG: sodium:proton antiporter NhaD [Pseudobdellovibrionaceae bacterium]